MKKLLAILLCLAMALTLSIPAFAVELDSSPAYDNDEGDYGIGINGKFNAAEQPNIKVSVDIIWEKMEFTYTGGEKSGWDAEHHTYASEGEGSWSENKPAITVKNHSEVDITATFAFNAGEDVETVGTFYANNNGDYTALVADEQAISLLSAVGTVRSEDAELDETPTGVIYFGVSGASVSEDTRLGSIVVTITADLKEYTVVTDEQGLYNAMTEGGYIRLGDNITFTGDYYIYMENVDVVLDLNGFTITGLIGLNECTLAVTDRIGTGTINGRDYAAIIANDTTLNIRGGNFVTDSTYSVYTEKSNVNISGGTFTGANYSVVNALGTADISGGTFLGPIGNSGEMTITGGNIDCGSTSAVHNYGTLTVSGGNIAGYFLNEGDGTITVTGGSFGQDPSAYVDLTEYIVVENDGVYTLDANTSGVATVNTADALKKTLEAGGNVKLGSSFELTSNFEIDADVTRTLDLNGYILAGTIRLCGGTLTVKDSVGTGAITSAAGEYALGVIDGSTLNIEGGTFSRIVSYSEVNISGGNFIGYDTLDIFDGAKLTMTGGTVVAENDALYVSGEAEVSGGSFTGKVRASDSAATLTITGGSFSQDPSAYVDITEYIVVENDGVYTLDVNTSGVATVNTADALKRALEAGGAVRLGSGIEMSDTLVLNSDATRTLDLNGQTLTGVIRLYGGSLTVKDGAETAATEGVSFALYDENCVLTIENGTYGYISANEGTLNISGGFFNGTGIDVFADASATITGGTFTSTGSNTLYVAGDVEISGGDFTGYVSVTDGGTLTITDGTFINTDGSALVADGGTANVSGGDFTGDIYVRGESDTLTISGGTFNVSFSGIPEEALTVIGGTFSIDPTEYVDTDNYDVTASDGMYTVTAKTTE